MVNVAMHNYDAYCASVSASKWFNIYVLDKVFNTPSVFAEEISLYSTRYFKSGRYENTNLFFLNCCYLAIRNDCVYGKILFLFTVLNIIIGFTGYSCISFFNLDFNIYLRKLNNSDYYST